MIHFAVPPAPRFRPRSTAPESRCRANGFSLTEMAIVLVIVALLVGGMLMPLAAQDEVRRSNETQANLNRAVEALLGFAAANGRLPRPATSSTNGLEMAANCADDAACSGFLPWATLGIQKLDSWNKLIRYSVTPDFANAAITLNTVPNRTVQTRDDAGAIADLAGNNTAAPAQRCQTTTQCVPAVIFSHGKERWGTTESGVAMLDGSATNIDEDANNTGPLNYFSRTPSGNTASPGGEFDDLVVWLPMTVLVNRMIAAGRLP